MVNTKKISKVKLGEISKAILGLVVIAGIIPMVAVAPGLAHIVAPIVRRKKFKSPARIPKSIDALVSSGLLQKTFDTNGEVTLKLTKKGIWETGIRNITGEDQVNSTWDGKWRIMVFDIPEHKRAIRSELRRAVILYGFIKLQQSVWIYPYPCSHFIELVRSHLDIKSNVLVITAANIENDKKLKREFNLK